ncbi:MAG TPA: hypothetical protein VL485_23910 [Ktedonobacteraceae bacterium]|nr:hypothetical protein [Ktedonobacteraceae bacterium]
MRRRRSRLKAIHLEPLITGPGEEAQKKRRSVPLRASQTPLPEIPMTPGSVPPLTPQPEIPITPEPEIPITPQAGEPQSPFPPETRPRNTLTSVFLRMLQAIKNAYASFLQTSGLRTNEILWGLFVLLAVCLLVLLLYAYVSYRH